MVKTPSQSLMLRGGHSSVWQLRVDAWSTVADLARRLSDPTLSPDGRADWETDLVKWLEQVAPFEKYSAAPGPRAVGELQNLIAVRDYELASKAADRVARSLVRDTASPVRDRPSFEVLVVADIAPDDSDVYRRDAAITAPG